MTAPDAGPRSILEVVTELRDKVNRLVESRRQMTVEHDRLLGEVYKLRGRPGQPRRIVCGAVWASHGCDLTEGHDGPHECHLIDDEGEMVVCSTCDQGAEDEFVRPGPTRWCRRCRDWTEPADEG